MSLLTKRPSEIINPRKWTEFIQIRKLMILAYRNQDHEKFKIEVEKIRKLSRGNLLKILNKFRKLEDSEHKNICILKELSLDKEELTAIMKN